MDEVSGLLCPNVPELVCIDNSPVASVLGLQQPLVSQPDPAGFDYVRGAFEDLVATAQNFGAVFINAANVRSNYVRKIRQMADQVMADVRAGRTTVEAAAEYARGMRDFIMQQSRNDLSAIARSLSVAEKEASPAISVLVEKYVARLFPGRQFIELATAERRQVFEAIIEAAGRSGIKFTRLIPGLRLAGRGCVLFTAAVVVYDLWTAQNKIEAGLNDALVFGGGAAGGAIAGAATGLVCGPAAPFCSTALFIVGGLMGAMAGQVASNLLATEIHEFSTWLGDL
jgi:hypothetical protein